MRSWKTPSSTPKTACNARSSPTSAALPDCAFWVKLNTNLRQIITSELPKLGGSWVTAFFLVGLLLGFRNPAIARLRYFLLGCGLVLVFAQALGRTQLSEDSPEINSENLLVLLAPLVLVYGVSLFFLLLDQIHSAVPAIALPGHRRLLRWSPACRCSSFSCRPGPTPSPIRPTTRPRSRPSPAG